MDTARLRSMRDRLDAELDISRFRVRHGTAPRDSVVSGSRTHIWSVIKALRTKATRELLSCDDTTNLQNADVPDRIRALGPQTLSAALHRGVTIRQITTRPGLLADRDLGSILHRAGGQARIVERIPFKVSILDRRVACVATDHLVLADGFRLVRDPVLVRALVTIHGQLWRSGSEPNTDRAELPPRLAVLLPALARGEPDEVACRRVGLSPRSYSRRMSELLGHMGVRTRFEAPRVQWRPGSPELWSSRACR